MSQVPTSTSLTADMDPLRLHSQLYGKAAQLWTVWKVHAFIFNSEENLQRMNAISPGLFRTIQESLIHDLIRMVYALTDAPGDGKKKNLSMPRLVEAAVASCPLSASSLQGKLASLNSAVASLRTHRNRRLMHYDLDTASAKSANLPPLLYGDLKTAATLIGELMSDVSILMGRGLIDYDFNDKGGDDGAFSWLLSDWDRFRMLRELAKDELVPDSVLREMVKQRSGRNDPSDPRKA